MVWSTRTRGYPTRCEGSTFSSHRVLLALLLRSCLAFSGQAARARRSRCPSEVEMNVSNGHNTLFSSRCAS
jgi:hypothetical protein